MSKIQWEYDLVERPFCEQLNAMGRRTWIKVARWCGDLKKRATDRRPPGSLFFPAIALNQVVERCNAFLFEEVAQLFVTADTEVAVVLPLNRAHVGIVPLVAELPILIAAAIAAHSWRIFSHGPHPPSIRFSSWLTELR